MKHLRLALIVIVALLLATSVFAQRYKITQKNIEFDRNVLFGFSDRAGMQDADKRAEFFLNISEDELNKVAKANGLTPEMQNVVIFVDAATGNFRTDTESADGKESMFFYKKQQEACMVNWSAGDFTCMNLAKMGDYAKQAQEALKNMPDIEKMLQNIPDPAAREKAMKAYKDAQKGGMSYPGMQAAKSSLEFKKTGKTRRDEYQISFTDGDERGVAWVSKKHMDLAKVAQSIAEDLEKSFGGMGGDDIRAKIKDGFPMEIRTLDQNMMRGQARLEVEKVTNIEKGFSGNPFDFDRSKLNEKSPMSMGQSKMR